jgi:hypothetical protein
MTDVTFNKGDRVKVTSPVFLEALASQLRRAGRNDQVEVYGIVVSTDTMTTYTGSICNNGVLVAFDDHPFDLDTAHFVPEHLVHVEE